jgi:hypothetical protein
MLNSRRRYLIANYVKLIAIGVVAVGFSLWEGGQQFATTAAHISIAVAIIAIVITALAIGAKHQDTTSTDWLKSTGRAIGRFTRRPDWQGVGAAIWLLLFLAVFGWDLNSFLRQQVDLPTLSRIVGNVTKRYGGRTVLVAAWLAGGWYLAAGRLTGETSHRHTIRNRDADRSS